jgi:hypothetical protein
VRDDLWLVAEAVMTAAGLKLEPAE